MAETQLEFQDQSAHDLKFHLVHGSVDKKLLTVLSKSRIECEDMTLEFGIIGASHYLECKDANGNTLFTEVVACIDLGQDTPSARNSSELKPKATNVVRGMKHEFRSEIVSWDENVDEKMSDLILRVEEDMTKKRSGLFFAFPEPPGSKYPAFTLVCANSDPEGTKALVETIHSYPNEGSVVFTKSVIQKGGTYAT